MRELPRAIRLKGVVTFATLLGSKGGGMLGALEAKLKQPEPAAGGDGEGYRGQRVCRHSSSSGGTAAVLPAVQGTLLL